MSQMENGAQRLGKQFSVCSIPARVHRFLLCGRLYRSLLCGVARLFRSLMCGVASEPFQYIVSRHRLHAAGMLIFG